MVHDHDKHGLKLWGRLICWWKGEHEWTYRGEFKTIEWDFCYRCCNAISALRKKEQYEI